MSKLTEDALMYSCLCALIAPSGLSASEAGRILVVETQYDSNGSIPRQPRFSDSERANMEMVCRLADKGAYAQARSMENIGAWTESQIIDTYDSAVRVIATVRDMLKGEL